MGNFEETRKAKDIEEKEEKAKLKRRSKKEKRCPKGKDCRIFLRLVKIIFCRYGNRRIYTSII